MMNRRDFSTRLGVAGLVLATADLAQAQDAPVEGRHFVRLSQPAPISLPSPDKKVEVVEFFWYECPHCNAFEPTLEAWATKLPADVAFRRVPVGFTARHQMAQKLFYALEESGQIDTMHARVYAAVHVQGQRLTSESAIFKVVESLGGDMAKFTEAYRGFSVNTKSSRARQLSDAYKIDGVPAIGVHGRYYTSATLTGSFQNTLAVTDFLVNRVRKGA